MTQLNQINQLPPEQEENANTSTNPLFSDIVNQRMSRRTVLKGGTGLTAAAFFGALPLVGCSDNDKSSNNDNAGTGGSNDGNGSIINTEAGAAVPADGDLARPQALKFKAVAHSIAADVSVAEGYNAEVILSLGTPLVSGLDEWKDNREQPGESFQYRMGDNHDGMWFFGNNGGMYDPKASESGLLVMNHEYVNSDKLSPNGFYAVADAEAETIYQNKRLASDVRREVNCHGVSVVEMRKRTDGKGYDMVKDSMYNNRITSASDVKLAGPVAGHDLVKTKFDNTGMMTRGINNQCGAGLSPWGTYITTEENFKNVFARGADASKLTDKQNMARARYSLDENEDGRYLWHTPDSESAIFPDEFARWDATAMGETALQDYRNGFNTFGYITEINPFDKSAKPVKRTALGRFAHENCAYAPVEEGKPVVFYMGDDARGEYIYKFVSAANWSNADIGGGIAAGDKYLNEGTLYVAVFNEDGSGEWKELSYGENGLDSTADFAFADQAEILVYTRLAGDTVGATKMDRPEWLSVSPMTGEVYCTLTNNANGSRVWDNKVGGGVKIDTNAANPRDYSDNGNVHGHIIRWAETDGNHASTTFEWDIYLFAAPNDLTAENLSGLNANNDLSAPDGLYFDPRGVLWIQTDDGKYTDTTSCMLLAALPGEVGDGSSLVTSAGQTTRMGMQVNDDNIKRFFVGPEGCEVTGITLTPDFKTLFINIQHPGNAWGAVAGGEIPRSSTVMITKNDGGVILGESFV